MIIDLFEENGVMLARLVSDEVEIKTVQDALDFMMDARYQGADGVIIEEENIIADFFDLKTKLAGDILQKFSLYQTKLAIVGDFEKYTSKSLCDFIYESNKGGNINFVKDINEAICVLTK